MKNSVKGISQGSHEERSIKYSGMFIEKVYSLRIHLSYFIRSFLSINEEKYWLKNHQKHIQKRCPQK